jgi:UDP-N-acetylglucosamine--N-acetylmuramyl-(pentapeptide) pyrophosphoryl-undecaprenol N-acetylglucosamine transferase
VTHMRILFGGGGTGGHLYPGLAIARALVRAEPSVEPFFVGAERGVERDVLPTAGFLYELLDLHPLYRSRVWENWRTVAGLSGAWRRIGTIAAERPVAAVVGTGGYAAGALLAYAARRGIPIALQEQNSHPGVTTRFFSRHAREVYLGFPEAERLLHHSPGTTYVDTGNPIEPPPAPLPDRGAARRAWGFPDSVRRVLLVVGGSQGARGINAVVDQWIAGGLPAGLGVIWGTGKQSFDDYRHRESETVRVRAYLSPIMDAYAASDLAVSRAGAMATAELCAWGIPMILVPLPTAAADHQSANARTLAAAGAALTIRQVDFVPERLDAAVRQRLNDPKRLETQAAAARARARPDAADVIAQRVLALARVHAYHGAHAVIE